MRINPDEVDLRNRSWEMFAEGKEWDDDPKPTADDIIEVMNYLGYHCFNISIAHDKSHHMWTWACQIKKIENGWMKKY